MAETEHINFTIDGRQGRTPKGTMLIVAAERMGIYIPRFCHHETMKPYGGCRMCLVDIEGIPKLQASCTIPVSEGMVVDTQSENVKKNQRAILEFILIHHPLDCPICDKGGECPLQDQYYEFSSSLSRFDEHKHFNHHVSMNSTIEQDFNRCVKCKRCIRYTYEVATDDTIAYEKRGVHTKVSVFHNHTYESVFSGNIIELCPVGALTDNIWRFKCRSWELHHKQSICLHCVQHCHIDQQYRAGEIQRIFASEFEPINEGWLCDKGRFHHEYLKSKNRITRPMEKVDGKWEEIDWKRALDLIVSRISSTLEKDGPGSVGGIIENDHTLEEMSAFRKLFWEIIQTPSFDSHPNLNGLRTEKSGYFLKNLPTFEQIANSKAVLNIDCDLVSEVPMLALKIRKTMINSGVKPFNIVSTPTETSKLMPEIIVPLDKYSSFLADLIRQLLSDEKIAEESRTKILDSLTHIPTLADAQLKQTIDTITDLVRTQRVSLLMGSNILKSDSELLKLTKILIELFEKLQQIPVIMPILSGGNSVGAELLNIHPMLPSSGAGGDMEHTGGQSADEMIFAAIHGKIKTLLVFSHRFATNLPKYEWDRGLEKLEYLIWADYFLSDLNEHADLLLPLQSPYEKTGCVVNNEGRFDTLKPSIKPAGEIMPTLEILSKVADGLDNSSDLTAESLQKEIMSDERFGEKLSPGGFVFVDTKRDFIDKVSTIKEHTLPETNAKFPFVLLPVKLFWPGEKTVLNSPVVLGRLPEFSCRMNYEDAANRKMKTGDTVEVSTEHGSIKAKLIMEKKLPKGYVTIPVDYMENRLGVLMLSGKSYFRCQVGQVFS